MPRLTSHVSVLILGGFPSAQAAQSRSREIAKEAGFESPSVHWFRWIPIGEAEWALEVAPDEADRLTADERARLVGVRQIPVGVHPTPVYRYMDHAYVEEFFSTGKLRLSCFEQFARLENERLRDAQEGMNVLGVSGRDSTLYVVSRTGGASLVLSTSFLGPWLTSPFQGRDCVEIRNPLAFATAIARRLDDCVAAVVGACSYLSNRTGSDETSGRDFLEAVGLEAIARDAEEILQFSPMFTKPEVYQAEREFRFVWRMNRPVTEPLEIVSHEARDICRRVSPGEVFAVIKPS